MFTNSNLFSFEEGIAKSGNIQIYYRDYGPADGEPILLVQGIGGQLINWPQHLIEFLIENNLFVNDKILKYCKTRQTFKKKINF